MQIPIRHYLALGDQAAGEVSRALQAVDVLVLAFVHRASERHGSLRAGLAHGCCVLSTTGYNTRPALRSVRFLRATPVGDPAAFEAAAAALASDRARRLAIGVVARAAYAKHCDWPVVARALLQRA